MKKHWKHDVNMEIIAREKPDIVIYESVCYGMPDNAKIAFMSDAPDGKEGV